MKLLDRLSDLASEWWTQVPNGRATYNYRTDTRIVGVKCETPLDGGAGVNSWAEEIVVGAINVVMVKVLHGHLSRSCCTDYRRCRDAY